MSFELSYPSTIVSRFASIATRHIESLPPDYYKLMREFTENGNYLPAGEASIHALGFDFAEDYKKMLPPAVLVQKYMSSVGAKLADVLAGYDVPEPVGEIDGAAVLFLRGPGLYYFEAPCGAGLLEVGLTGAFYPPVLPRKRHEP